MLRGSRRGGRSGRAAESCSQRQTLGQKGVTGTKNDETMISIRCWKGVSLQRIQLSLLAGLIAVGALAGFAGASASEYHALPSAEIVFARTMSDVGRPSLYLMASTGSQPRLFVRDADEPSVSPDARSIAFVRASAIWLMHRDGTGQRQLSTPKGNDDAPAWSADGARVYFSRFASRSSEDASIFSVHSDGTHLQQLTRAAPTPHGDCHEDAAPSPEGRIIAYDATTDCEHGSNTSIRAVTVAGRTVRLPFRFPTTEDIEYGPAWASDGRLAYAAMDIGAFAAYPARAGASGIYISATDGSHPRRLTKGYDQRPAWSSDANWIVFERWVVKPNDYPGDIWLVRADGTEARPLTRTNADDSNPTWLPPNP